jgi:hypothetical protein
MNKGPYLLGKPGRQGPELPDGGAGANVWQAWAKSRKVPLEALQLVVHDFDCAGFGAEDERGQVLLKVLATRQAAADVEFAKLFESETWDTAIEKNM